MSGFRSWNKRFQNLRSWNKWRKLDASSELRRAPRRGLIPAEGRFSSVRQILSSPDYATTRRDDDTNFRSVWRFWHALPLIRTRISIASDLSIPLARAKSPGPLSGSHQKSLKIVAAFGNFGAKSHLRSELGSDLDNQFLMYTNLLYRPD